MNKDDNKNKKKTPFSEISSIQEIAKNKNFYELKKNKITTF